MPANPRSLGVTTAYRTRLQGIQVGLAREVRRSWVAINPDELDAFDAARVAALIEAAQRQTIQASAGYLTAYLTSEKRRRVTGPDPTTEIGTTPTGRPLSEATIGLILGVKARISTGIDPVTALSLGQTELLRLADTSADFTARQSLSSGLQEDDRFKGWRRAVRGTCGACLGAATGSLASPDEPIDTHPGCQCIQEPVVVGAPERVRRPSGKEVFDSYPTERQDALFGEVKASMLRSGTVALADLISHSEMAHQDNLLTEKPLVALT